MSLRLPEESESEFKNRAERAAIFAASCIDACLANRTVQEYLQSSDLNSFTLSSLRANPLLRVEYEEAFAIGGLGECLDATKHKHWGAGPTLQPLQLEDWFFPDRITFIYKECSRYNLRFEQRRKMKLLLGKQRSLVERARYENQKEFLQSLSSKEIWAIERILCMQPLRFWRAVRGKRMVTLPPVLQQGELPWTDASADDE